LFGAARDLRRDLLGTFEQAMLDRCSAPVGFRVGPPRLGFTATAVFEPEGARQVLATGAAHYEKDVPALEEFRRFVGDGLLTSDGDRWRRDRRIVAPLFTRKRIGSYVGTMAEAAERLVAAWQEPVGGGAPVDLCEPSMKYALEVLGTTVFGAGMPDAEAVIRRSIPILNEQVTRTALSPVRLPSWVPTGANRRADRARREVWGFVDGLIDERRSTGSLDGGDLLSLLLTARDPETGEALDDRAVRDQALIFLLAGHETTGATLAFALDLLGRHQDVQQRVRDEVGGVAGTGPIGAEHLERLRYTAQVLNETMRLYPAGHTVVRRARQPTTLAGHVLPPGRIVAVSVWSIHHNPTVWPDPYRFDPDRFAPEQAEDDAPAKATRYAHLPFGGGPRSCIGQYLAMAEMTVAVASVVRAFTLRSETEEPELDVGVSLLPKGTLPCRLLPAGGGEPGGRAVVAG